MLAAVALDPYECSRLVDELGPTSLALILCNHGLVTLVRSVQVAILNPAALEQKICPVNQVDLDRGY